MSFRRLVILFAAAALAAPAADLSGTWKLRYSGPNDEGPKTVGSIILHLKVGGDALTGTAYIGLWPGEAPIADGKVDGDRITFTATGHLSSTTGIPTCRVEASLEGDEMVLALTAIRNAFRSNRYRSRL